MDEKGGGGGRNRNIYPAAAGLSPFFFPIDKVMRGRVLGLSRFFLACFWPPLAPFNTHRDQESVNRNIYVARNRVGAMVRRRRRERKKKKKQLLMDHSMRLLITDALGRIKITLF